MWRKVNLLAALLLVLGAFVALPAQAQQNPNPVWYAQYFSDTNWTNQVFDRQEANIAQNWGTGSPVSGGIGADSFSVRWATDVALSPGTYRFYALADDYVQIIFNFGETPIDTFGTGQVDTLVTGDVTVTSPGTYHIQVDYRELTGPAFIYVSFVNLATNPQGPNFPIPVNPTTVPVGGGGTWTAQYFANQNLLGDPAVIVGVNNPSFNYGSGSPYTAIPADNFSARFTNAQGLAAGTYNITVRADDGVRVYVNGVLVINEWHTAAGQTYSTNIALPSGTSTFVVEYFENTGAAYLDYNLSLIGGTGQPVPQPTQPVGGVTATVTAYRLNVRNAPDPVTGDILTRISRGETYSVIARNADSSWYLLNINGTQGWVSGAFVNIAPFGANIPVAGGEATAQPPQGATGNEVIATPYNVVIRQGPGTQFQRIGLFPVGQTADVIGRNANNTWWQINYNGLVGWVSAQYARIGQGANVGAIPITG